LEIIFDLPFHFPINKIISLTNENAGQISLASAYALIIGSDYLETDTYDDLYLKNLGYGSYEERTANLILTQVAFAGLEEVAGNVAALQDVVYT